VRYLTFHSPGKLNISGNYIYEISTGQLTSVVGAQGLEPLSIPYQNLSVHNDNNQYITFKDEKGLALYKLPFFSWSTILFEENKVWVPSNELYDGLVSIDVQNQYVDTFPIGYYFIVNLISGDSQYIWMSNYSEVMIVNKQTGESQYWGLPYESPKNIAYQDSKYLYLWDRHSVMIIPKSKVLNECMSLVKVKAEEALLNQLIDSTRISFINDIRPWYKSYKRIHSFFKETTSRRILASLSNIREKTAYMTPDLYLPFDDALFSYIDSIEEQDVLAGFSHALMIYAARKGELARAIELDNELRGEFPAVDTNDYAGRQKVEIRKAYLALQALKAIDIPEDERLLATGNIYLTLFKSVGREREVGMDLDYPISFYFELLRKYPSSQFADNAEYLIFSYGELSSREGGESWYSMEVDQWYNRFIERYPKSDLISKVYLDLVGMYYSSEPDSRDRKKYLNLAKQYADKFYREYPAHPLKPEMDQYMEYVNEELKGQQ
ncbi:MAG TPA: hypothetical protein VGK46_14345, partial [Saprospiraceae bacterium]